jgi:hypothetical protein
MIAHTPSIRFEAAGLVAGVLIATAQLPVAAAEVCGRRDVGALGIPVDVCGPAHWLGRMPWLTQIADRRDAGWWVVLATAPENQDVSKTVRALKACGLRPFNDFSGKFAGFKPGLQVVVDGAYSTRAEAESVKVAARQCVPDAYVKWARYLGE